jgi:hypothetical protein
MYEALERALTPKASQHNEIEESNDQTHPQPQEGIVNADKPRTEQTPDDHRQQGTQSGLFLTGDQQEDFEDANDALWEALWARNADIASKILSDWHKMYDSVEDLVDAPWQNFLRTSGLAPTAEWFSIMTEALRKAALPEDDIHRDSAFSSHTQQLERVDQLPIEEKRRRYDIKKRVAELVTEPMNDATQAYLARASTEALEEFLEGLEQENDNLEAMLAGKTEQEAQIQVVEAPKAETTQPQKPDILSILSTTQTIRSADGTVTTKVVLKKRFADGSEESTESTHTRKEKAEDKMEKQTQQQQPETEKRIGGKATGWFWS